MAACSLAKGSRKQYGGHFNILAQAAEAGGFDPLAMSINDVHFSCLFFVLSRSVFSLDSFLSGVEHHLSSNQTSLPGKSKLKPFKRALRRLFGSADTPVKAFALSRSVVHAMVALLDPLVPVQALIGAWLLIAFLFALRPEDITAGKIRWSDFTFREDGSFDLLIRAGKSSTRIGDTVFSMPAAPPKAAVDPNRWVAALWKHAFPSVRPTSKLQLSRSRPFSNFDTGKFLRSSKLASYLKHLYSAATGKPAPVNLTAYSLRRGGATEHLEAKMNPVHLKHLMRHASFNTTADYIDTVSTRSSRMEFTKSLLLP